MGRIMRIPFPGMKNWVTSFLMTLTGNGYDGVNYSHRQSINSSDLDRSGTSIRVTFQTATAEGLKVDNVSIGERDGASANTVATPVELLFSGGSGFDIAADNQITSDALNFIIDKTKNYIIVVDCSSIAAKDGNKYKASTGNTCYYKAVTDSYNQASVSDFSNFDGITYVNKIEVR